MKLDKIYRFMTILVFIYGTSASPVTTENSVSTVPTDGPCQNFYEYACLNQAKNPGFESLIFQAQKNVKENLEHLKEAEIIEEDIQPLKMMNIFYNSCSDNETINSQGLRPISLILNSFGAWPISADSSNGNNLPDWQSLLSFYGKLNVFPLYKITAHDDVYWKSNKIQISQPTTMLINDEDNDIADNARERYLKFIQKIADILDDDNELRHTREELTSLVNEIVSFEIQLSKILSPEDLVNFYKPTPLKVFQEVTNTKTENSNVTFNWANIINSLYSGSLVLVNDNTVIDVSNPEYYSELIRLLEKTPLHTIVNYIHWKFILEFLPYTSDEVRNMYFDIKDILQNPVVETSRVTACKNEPVFERVTSYQYAKQYITPEIEASANEILNDVKEAAIATIQDSTFPNANEKYIAISKVSNMKFTLGISEDLKDLSKLLEFYSNRVLVIGKNYFENILSIRRFSKMKELEEVHSDYFKNTENDQFMKISQFFDVAFKYSFFTNEAYIKTEHLTQPLFDPNYSDVKKYGILGFVFAKSIMKGFDESESIGVYKNSRPTELYSSETKNKFWDKQECFTTQNITDMEKYTQDIDVSSLATLNMGDSAAIEIAYRAYCSKTKGEQSTADNKEFFKLFTDLLCTRELQIFHTRLIGHLTMPEYRVLGSLPNIQAFTDAYACPKGSRMNPEKKCSFWN